MQCEKREKGADGGEGQAQKKKRRFPFKETSRGPKATQDQAFITHFYISGFKIIKK